MDGRLEAILPCEIISLENSVQIKADLSQCPNERGQVSPERTKLAPGCDYSKSDRTDTDKREAARNSIQTIDDAECALLTAPHCCPSHL